MESKFCVRFWELFEKDKGIHVHMQMGFSHFIDQNKHIPEYLSLYLDEKFCKGFKEVCCRLESRC